MLANVWPMLKHMLTRGLPIAITSNFLLYLTFLKTNTNTWIDFGWSFNQFLIAASFCAANPSLRSFLSLGLVGLWAGRLCSHLYLNRVAKHENDPRYERMAEKALPGYRKTYFFFQFMLQAALVVFPAIPLYYIFNGPKNFTWNFWAGAGLALVSLALEATADRQLEQFKALKQNDPSLKGKIYRDGLWTKSRHPNLFWDFMTWNGISLMGFSSLANWPIIIGPLSLYYIMAHLTIPITEGVMKKSRPNWDEQIKGTNQFFPF